MTNAKAQCQTPHAANLLATRPVSFCCRMDHHAGRCNRAQVQRCTLLSIKTGGCPENCSYCSQSSAWRQETGLKVCLTINSVEKITQKPLTMCYATKVCQSSCPESKCADSVG